jgi:serine/threonine-protein kinase HipA
MRVGSDGADSTLENAYSEAALFGLTASEARKQAAQVAKVCGSWKAHFTRSGVTATDIDYLAHFIDRDFLKDQREELTALSARRAKPGVRKR